MIVEIAQNFPIQTFNGHCYAIKTGLEYITFYVPITHAVKNNVSGSIECCCLTVAPVASKAVAEAFLLTVAMPEEPRWR